MNRSMINWRAYGFTAALAVALASSAAQAIVLYVDDDAPPGGDGLTWNSAYRFLQDAMAFANVPAGDINAAASAIAQLCDDRPLARRHGLAAAELVRTACSPDEFCEQMEQAYDDALNQRILHEITAESRSASDVR